jgi:hypothetical protein
MEVAVRRAALALIVALIAVVLVASLHPLTPARTFDAYELKARGTAKSALSSVETARLAARVGSNGKAFGPYTSVLLSEAEEGVGHAHGTFLGIQPPDAHADAVRRTLDDLLSRAEDELGTLRIAARRGELSQLGRHERPLARLARQLNRFIDSH